MAQIDDAKQDYLSGMKYKDIAAKYDVSLNTVKSWRRRHGWQRGAHKKGKKGAPSKNEYAVGNAGGAAPIHNKNAVTHGLFAKWLPDDTSEILQVVEQQSPADIIWQNITLQYTAIVRAQQIMYVKDQDDISSEVFSDGKTATSFEIQYAWDKQATFMTAQSRAMGTLGSLIKQFVAIADENDIRRKRITLMEAQVDKAKAEVAQLKRDSERDNLPLPTFVDDIPEDDEEIGGDTDGNGS